METDKYEQTVITMLSDDNTYEKLNKHPTTKYKKKLISIINKLKDEHLPADRSSKIDILERIT